MVAEGVSLVVHFPTFFTPGLDPGVLFAALEKDTRVKPAYDEFN